MDIKVVYYICPQIWASRKGRIKNMQKFVDAVIPIFPFEEKIYEKVRMNVFYAGNPLVDIIDEKMQNEAEIFTDGKHLIGLMPGSRMNEIKNILPIFLEVISRLIQKYANDFDFSLNNLKFCLILSENIDEKLVRKYIAESGLSNIIEIFYGPAYKLRRKMRFILTSSGTSSFENFILNVPMMIFYKMDSLSFFIAKLIVKVKFIGMPNILAEKMIMPEYIQDINYEKVAEEVYDWIKNDKIINSKKNDLVNLSIKCGLTNPDNCDANSENKIIKNISEYVLRICKES